MKSTFQSRISEYLEVELGVGNAALAAYAELYGRVERRLFADVAAGSSAGSLKSAYLRRYGIPARMFNGVRVSLEGKIASVREQQKLRADGLERRIRRAERQIALAVERGQSDQVHQKRRRLGNLKTRLAALEADIAADRVRLCFGSKGLWRKQYHLEANGYSGSTQSGSDDWRDARSGEFFVLGSRDETAGCQLCVASVADDGTLTLRLRMPDCLSEQHGKHLVIQGVRFAYGQEQVLAALESNAEYAAYRREHGEGAARQTGLGQAVCYRFKRDAKGWRVFVTTDLPSVPVVTDRMRGVIGVDINADHLAVAETDASGNYIECLAGAAGDLREVRPSGGGPDWGCGGRRGGVRQRGRQAHRHRAAGLPAEEGVPGGRVPPVQPHAVRFQLRKDQGLYFLSRGYRQGVGINSGEPGLQFGDRPGEVHGAVRAHGAPGSGPGAGPTLAWLFRAHPTPAGLSRRPWRSCRLHRTCKEAGEARVDVLGCGLGAAETGACSANTGWGSGDADPIRLGLSLRAEARGAA